MNSSQVLERIHAVGIVAIMRTHSSDQLLSAADAILDGGINAIEVTMTTPGAIEVVQQAGERYGAEVIFGAGTVLDSETARTAILAGAQFIVSPSLDIPTIQLCRRYSVLVIPGAYTPTEVVSAWQAGADMVKLFPASFGGPAYLKAIKAPLPQVRLVPVGGVDVENTAEFIKAGADVVAVGSALINQKLLDEGDLRTITERAKNFREQVEVGRKG